MKNRNIKSKTALIFLAVFIVSFFSAVPFLVHATALGDLAASMVSGEWRVLTTSNLSNYFIKVYWSPEAGSAPDSLLGYGDEAQWDPISKQLFIGGGSHNYNGRIIAYSADNNSWRVISALDYSPYWSAVNPIPGGTGIHGYNRTGISASRRQFYYMNGYNPAYIQVYNIDNNTWGSPFGPAPGGTYENANAEYFPELDSIIMPQGSSGGNNILREYNLSTGIWSSNGSVTTGAVHDRAVYNPVKAEVIMGGGQNDPIAWQHIYKLSNNNVLSQMADAPMSIGAEKAFFTPDPVAGKYLVFDRTSEYVGTWWTYDSTTDVWTLVQTCSDKTTGACVLLANMPTEDTGRTTGCVTAAISNYGVTMFVCTGPTYYMAEGSGRVLIYKHATTSDTTPPSAPTGLTIG